MVLKALCHNDIYCDLRPNLHAQHHNLDTLERLVFEDFNGSPYTSKSTIVISGWESICCNFKLVRRKFEFVDPRGYINIAWLSIQVSKNCSIFDGYFCGLLRIYELYSKASLAVDHGFNAGFEVIG